MSDAKQTRLLFVITLSAWGGAQSYVLQAAKEALRRGFDVLVAAGGHGDLAARCAESAIPYRELKRMKRSISPFADLAATAELRGLMAEWKPEIAYLHSSKAGVIGSRAARQAGVPRVVYRIGGWSFLDPVSPLQKWIRLRAERHSAKDKDVIVVLHPEDEALAKQYDIAPREEIAVIPNGIDLPSFDEKLLDRETARERLDGLWQKGLGKRETENGKREEKNPFIASRSSLPVPLVLTVANFYPAKNLARYLDAIAMAHNKNAEARFLIIGDGLERKKIEEKRRHLGLEGVVALPGAVADAAELLRGADLFVLPSAKEGMPWALLEATAAGLPCIATDVGACAWMLGENGWVVPPGDADALVLALFDALRDPARGAARGAAARRDVAWRFTAERMWEETFRVLAP